MLQHGRPFFPRSNCFILHAYKSVDRFQFTTHYYTCRDTRKVIPLIRFALVINSKLHAHDEEPSLHLLGLLGYPAVLIHGVSLYSMECCGVCSVYVQIVN